MGKLTGTKWFSADDQSPNNSDDNQGVTPPHLQPQTPSNHSECKCYPLDGAVMFTGDCPIHKAKMTITLQGLEKSTNPEAKAVLDFANAIRVSDLKELKESLPEKRKNFTNEWEKHQKFGYNKALAEVLAILDAQIEGLKQ